MNEPACQSLSPSAGLRALEDVTCERCGAHGAYLWDGAALCLQCTIEQGSCCSEFEQPFRPSVSKTPTAKFNCS